MSLPPQRSNCEEGEPLRDNHQPNTSNPNINNNRLNRSLVVHIQEDTHLTSTETECDADVDETVRKPNFNDNIDNKEVCRENSKRLEILPELLTERPLQNVSGELVTGDGRTNSASAAAAATYNNNIQRVVPPVSRVIDRNHCTTLMPYQPSNGTFNNTQSFCSQNILINKMERNVPTRSVTEELNCSDEELTRTITINISETPSSTAMHRPPLRERMIGVLSNAINFCLCSPFIKDCVIILGMYISFSILIFLLTLVSYNFLRANILQYRNEPRHNFCQFRSRHHPGQHQ